MYIENSTGEIFSEYQLRAKYPHKSFPKKFNENVCSDIGVDLILTPETPAPSSQYKLVEKDGIEQNSNGEWQWVFVERDMFPATDEKTTEQLIAEHKAQQKETEAESMRQKRDEMLSRTDWMACSDIVMSDEWKAYRQALRDVPQQSGFPETVEWPAKPA